MPLKRKHVPPDQMFRGSFQRKRGDPNGGKPRRTTKPDHGHGRFHTRTTGDVLTGIKTVPIAPPPPIVELYVPAPPRVRVCQWCGHESTRTFLTGLALGLLMRRLCPDCCAVAVSLHRKPREGTAA